MFALIPTIINAFVVLISFFRKIVPWIGGLTSFLGGSIAIKAIKVVALIAASAIVIALIFEFIHLIVSLFTLFIDGANSVTSALNSNTSGSVGSCLLFWLNQFGFVDGFNLALPFALGSLTTILMFLVYKYGSGIAVKIYSVVSKVF